MKPFPLPVDEAERLRALHGLRILDTPAERGFDAIAELARSGTGCPVGAVAFVDAERQWVKAAAGVAASARPRGESICAHAIHTPGLFVVRNAAADPRFADLPAVRLDPRLRAYAGMPIVIDGRRVGTVCCADIVPRDFGPACEALLRELAELAAALLCARSHAEGSQQRADELAHVAKSEFLSRMSHEMRTPLNAVIGFSQVLLARGDTPERDEVRAYAEHMMRAGQQLLDMTNDVLDLQRVEEGHLDLLLADVTLEAAAREVIAALGPAADARGVRLVHEVPAGLAVRADAQRLRQVLQNVASNAVKYNRPAGTVRWTAHAVAGERVRLAIEDTGAGLKPGQLQRLFQPFERLGRETSTIEGTGLGLIVARGLAEAMGGSLNVASTAGVGTCVTIELPRARGPALARGAEGACVDLASAAAAHPLRLLYVEDNHINALLFEQALRMHDGVELRLAENGTEALDQVREWQPDVLVLDAHLPGMDGFELLDELRQRPGLDRVPAFMCSADAMPDDVERAALAGFAGYWPKPIDIARILLDLDRVRAGLAHAPAGAATRG
ncbi:MAG TPA: ATP-binding protein [Albitalea sp.]